MEEYISKAALVAEIDRLENKLYYEPENFKDVGAKMALDSLKSSLDTLEVREVDLDEEIERFAKECGYKSAATIDFQFAKHFFELGMAVSKK